MKHIVALCLGLIILSGCGAKQEPKPLVINDTIENLLSMSTSLKCEYTTIDNGVTAKGIIYVDNKKMRGESESQFDGQTIKGYFISDGEWVYSWSEGPIKSAIKMKMTDIEEKDSALDETDGTKGQGINYYKEKMDYTCWEWKADNSYFNPPSDLQFKDMTTLFNNFNGTGIPTTGATGTDTSGNGFDVNSIDFSALCSQCESLADETSKTACRKNLKCQ